MSHSDTHNAGAEAVRLRQRIETTATRIAIAKHRLDEARKKFREGIDALREAGCVGAKPSLVLASARARIAEADARARAYEGHAEEALGRAEALLAETEA